MTAKWYMQFNATKASEFPMKKATVEIDEGRYDEVYLAGFLFNQNQHDLAAVERGLAEYREAPPARKIETLGLVLSDFKNDLKFQEDMRRLATSSPELAEKNKKALAENEAVVVALLRQIKQLEGYVATLRGELRKEWEEQHGATIDLPSNPPVHAALRGIMAAGPHFLKKGFWTLRPEAQTAEYKIPFAGGGIVTLWVDPKVDAERAVWSMEQIGDHLESYSALTFDVALCFLSCLADTSAPMLKTVEIGADDIIKQKKVEAWGRNRDALEVAIEKEVEILRRQKMEVDRMPGYDPQTGNYNKSGFSWRGDRLFDIVEVTEYQRTLSGEKEPVAVRWRIRAGQWAEYFLNPQGRRWVCTMARVALELSHRGDRRVDNLAKKIAGHVAMNGFREGKGQPLEWTLETLFSNIGENLEQERDPGRVREAFENAVGLLKDKGVFKTVEFSPGYAEDTDRSRGWVKRWLKYKVTFTLPDVTELEQELESQKLEQMARAALPRRKKRGPRRRREELVNGATLRRERTARYIRQEDLAHQLGITRKHLSQIENGKALPSHELTRQIKKWLDQLEPIE